MKILVVLGTRPEAIKMAPVILEARERGVETIVCVTAQHREMLDQVLGLFAIQPEIDLDLMEPDQTLASLTARALLALDKVLADIAPDWVLVQGDTTTAMVAALAAFYRKIPVGHIEAGLRTGDLARPFPEELNRRLADAVSGRHFLPTPQARENLLSEGFASETMAVTGNTVVDALQWVRRQPAVATAALGLPEFGASARLVLVTAHRRESFGAGMQSIARALVQIVDQNPDVQMVYPLHRNPNVRRVMEEALGAVERIHLLPPLDYLPFVQLMAGATLILSDSGGVQEEAPSLGVPALVLRETTERPEAVAAGAVQLVGLDEETIVREANILLQDPAAHQMMAVAVNPYGDGQASARIVSILLDEPWAEFRP
ncbi:MAG TPA: UDP-N-acetylglucosamine 2-epimerase (non-hydrolyzing) [Deltaproteobacteria bacterium]|nr:UDP-N-acetylglucosamine 2-epimerase (non-hydrolyzing) [Deltaproteobacteria bacterium]